MPLGFSLVEVLISMLMIAAFLTTALQALIAATAIKVKAEEISEATAWMQDDLETIRFEASQLSYSREKCEAVFSGDLTQLSYTDELKTVLASVPSTVPPINPNNARLIPKVSTLGGRSYLLRRTLSIDPNQRTSLQVTHEVFRDFDQDLIVDSEEIRTQYSEVIPDVIFSCE